MSKIQNEIFYLKDVLYPNFRHACFFTNLVEAFLYIGLLRNAGRKSACTDCHLNAVGMAGCQNSDKNRNLAEEWPGMVAVVYEGCREAVRVYSKRKLNS